MSITSLDPLPSQETRPESFDLDVENFFAKLPRFAEDIDAARNQAVAASEAGANGYPFLFDVGTTASDPGVGELRLNTTAVGMATSLYVSATSSAGAGIGALLDTFGDSTSTNKGTIRLVKSSDPQRFVICRLNSVSKPGDAYRSFSITPLSVSGPTPFASGDQIVMQFAPSGDRGTKGEVGNADKVVQSPASQAAGTTYNVNYIAGAAVILEPAPGAATINIQNWPAAGNLGEMIIFIKNAGQCTLKTSVQLNYLKSDGSYILSDNVNANQGATLRNVGEDQLLIWGHAGAPKYAKVAR